MTTALVRSASDGSEALHEAGQEAARHAIRNACREASREVELESVVIEKDAIGQPYGRIPGDYPRVTVSISHSFPFALATATVSDGVALGSDIERIRDFAPSMWETFLTSAEKKIIADAPAQNRAYLRTLCWSLKESVLKAIGIGLRMHPGRVDVAHILVEKRISHMSIGIDGTAHEVRVWFSRVGNEYIATAVALPTAGTYYGTTDSHRENVLYGNSRYNSWNHIANAPCSAHRTGRRPQTR